MSGVFNSRPVHEAPSAKLGPPSRTVSFETPTSATTPINAPPIPPRSESRLNSHSNSLSPERASTVSPPRPPLATHTPDWGIDHATTAAAEKSHADSLLQTSNRSHRQARVWRETQNYKDARRGRHETKHPSKQSDMAYPLSELFSPEWIVRLLALTPHSRN